MLLLITIFGGIGITVSLFFAFLFLLGKEDIENYSIQETDFASEYNNDNFFDMFDYEEHMFYSD